MDILWKIGQLEKVTAEQELSFTKDDPFIDYVENHVLPMVFVSEDGMVLYSNKTMDEMVGFPCTGKPAWSYYATREGFDKAKKVFSSNTQVKGLTVILKCHGKPQRATLYTSIHRDEDGKWLNSRCTFVPCG